uniref:Uncharacterized protein n=1 Tax=Rhizophora mucronata TaxID=61149 RepID=A0A2P2KAJ4_RHIMU
MGVPIIFDLVIGSTREPAGDERPSVAKQGMHSDYKIILISSDVPSLDVRPQIVHPSQSTALSTSEQTCFFRQGPPMAFTVSLNILGKQCVFSRSPWPPMQTNLRATRSSPHLPSMYTNLSLPHSLSKKF